MPKTKWREYLKGEYAPPNENALNKMHSDVRKRAKQMIEDLLLIAQKSNKRQRIRIFREPEIRKTIRSLIVELHNNSLILAPQDKEFEEIVRLMQELELAKVKYDWVKLVEEKDYRDQKRVQLESLRQP
jgi:hypothetical protein